MRIGRALVGLALSFAAGIAAASVFYKMDVVAQTGSGGIVSLGTGPSVNDKGKVAYIGRYAGGPSVFAWSPLGGATDIATSFLSPNRNFGEAVMINRHDEVLTWNRLLPLGLYEVRVFRSGTANDSSVMVRGLAGSQRYELLYQNPAMNAARVLEDNVSTIPTGNKDGVCDSGEVCVSQIAFNALVTLPTRVLGTVVDNPTNAADQGTMNEFGLNTSLSKPAIADDGRIVIRGNLASNPINLFSYALGSPTTIAGSAQGFTALGAAPGITPDGRVVAFSGNRGFGDGIFLSIAKSGGGRRIVRVAGENTVVQKAELGFNGSNQKLYFASIELDSRVGVAYTPGFDGTPNAAIVLSFIGTPNAASRTNPGTGAPFFFSAQRGLWTMRIELDADLFENVCMVRAPGVTGNVFTPSGDDVVAVANGVAYLGPGSNGECESENGHNVETLFARTGPIPVVQIGDRILADTVVNLGVHDPVAPAKYDTIGNARSERIGDHRVAFWADVGGGRHLIVRGEHLDSDQDGLMDHWETTGIDLEGTGTVDLDLAAMGANPFARDFFMQIDYTADRARPLNPGIRHLPLPGMARRLTQFYAGAPALPSGVPAGIKLHLDSGTMRDRSGQPVSRNMGTGALRGGKTISPTPIDIVYFGVPGSVNMPAGVNAQSFDGIKVANLWNSDRGARELAFTYIVWTDFHHALGGNQTPFAGAATGGTTWNLYDTATTNLGSGINGNAVKITAGPGAGQVRTISGGGADAIGRFVQVTPAWTTPPTAASSYILLDGSGGESSPGMRYDGAFSPGKNFALTLGGFGFTTPGYEQGSFLGQWQTLAHEIGHNQSLMHGGSNHDNYKVNYVSFMNYAYELCTTGVGSDANGNPMTGAASCPIVDYAGAADAVHNDWASLDLSSALNMQRMGQAFGNQLDPAELPFPPTPDDQTIADIKRRFPSNDDIVPTIHSVTPAGGTNVALGAGIAVSLNATDNIAVTHAEVLFDVNGDGRIDEPAEAFAAASSGGALYTVNVPATSGPAGPRQLVAAARDAGGNVGYATVVLTVGAVAPATVPNVVALSEAAARDALHSAQFSLGTITRVPSPSVPAGNIIAQTPAGAAVQPLGTPVALVVSLGPNGAVVPNVLALGQAAAASAIAAAGFVVGTITQAAPAPGPAGVVVGQAPDADEAAPLGSAVALLVSVGAGNVTVPDVVGMTQAAATTAITGAGLVLGTVTTQASASVPAGSVIAQSPLAGTSVPPGAAIALVVSLGPSCAAFSDVAASSPFCPNVEWMRNRAITLGCTATEYCPSATVIRLAMAAFMNRLGTALTPQRTFVEQASGALDPTAAPIVCATAPIAITGFPRRARLDGIAQVLAAADVTLVAEVVASTDGGTTWTALAAPAQAFTAPAGRWRGVRSSGTRDLAVGENLRFGLRIDRGGFAGAGTLSDSACRLRVVLESRQGASSPY